MMDKRIQVGFPAETMKAISEVAELRGMSHAAIVREMMVEATPVLHEVATALREVQKAPERAVERLAAMAGGAVEDFIQAGFAFQRKRGRPRKTG